MKRYCIYVTLFLLTSLLGCHASTHKQNAEPFPAPPAGFSWITSKNGVGSFLQPNGWFEKEDSQSGTNMLFLSKEKIKKNSPIEVGLSVTQINAWSSKHTNKPSEYAQSYAANLATTGTVLKQGVMKGDNADRHVLRIRSNNKGISTIAHHMVIGLDTADKVYLLSFEAPESQWETESQKGREMLNNFSLGE